MTLYVWFTEKFRRDFEGSVFVRCHKMLNSLSVDLWFEAQSVLLSATADSEIDHILRSLCNQDDKEKNGYMSRKTTPTTLLQSQS